MTERGHAYNILFLDSGASYICQVCENVLSCTLISYAFFCVSVTLELKRTMFQT